MLVPHHIEITRQAIGADISPRALNAIIRANIGQDNLLYQLGHDHFHFDNNQIEKSLAYIEEQRGLVQPALAHRDALSAWRAFGWMLHTAQDFYAHTDYIPRWLSCFERQTPPPPPEVDPVSSEILRHPGLHSGKLYYPFEALTFLPLIGKFFVPLFPGDSHAHMSIDDHDETGRFDYVFHAAVKRTRLEFEKTISPLSPNQLFLFTDR